MCAAPIAPDWKGQKERLAAPPLNNELRERDDAIFMPGQESGEVSLRIAMANRRSLRLERSQIRAEVRCQAQTLWHAAVRGPLTLRRLNHSWILYQFAYGVFSLKMRGGKIQLSSATRFLEVRYAEPHELSRREV